MIFNIELYIFHKYLRFGIYGKCINIFLCGMLYCLRSFVDSKLYIGSTNDIERRLIQHNSGFVKSTAPRKPFKLECYIFVKNKKKAIELEQYFKKGSGNSILKKRIL